MVYCYLCKNCGHRTEKVLGIKGSGSKFECSECGFEMQRDFQAEMSGFRDTPGAWPMESDAAGVHPDQIPEISKYLAERGVPTQFNSETGNPLFTSRDHRKRYCQATGLYDRNAGIGDATPRHNMHKPVRRKRCQIR